MARVVKPRILQITRGTLTPPGFFYEVLVCRRWHELHAPFAGRARDRRKQQGTRQSTFYFWTFPIAQSQSHSGLAADDTNLIRFLVLVY